jgi:prepilin-type N-terminal cleavage/methylation domain-containing protein
MTKAKKGFTLIEVILVLAIAAMIFLMVLLTLPAVQRAQRDMQRKEDVGKVIAAYTEFVGNNRGTQPIDAQSCEGADGGVAGTQENCKLNPYVRLTDGVYFHVHDGPTSGTWTPTTTPTGFNPDTDHITIYKKAQCDVNGAVKPGSSSRQIAVVVELEGAGTDGQSIYYCQES